MLSAFFCASKKKTLAIAWIGAVLVIGHAFVHAYVKKRVNLFYKDFYDGLENAGRLAGNRSTTVADWQRGQSDVLVELMTFLEIAAISCTVMPFSKWVRSVWTLRWRLALCESYVAIWDPNLTPIEGTDTRLEPLATPPPQKKPVSIF